LPPVKTDRYMKSSCKILSGLPDKCGVYLLRDKDGNIIYIGKSNSIKKRVSAHLRTKISDKIASADFILTKGELSALILEARLIKKHRPRYNISMRDDKQYPFIKISMQEEFPEIKIVRKKESDGAAYFGPYRSAGARTLTKTAARIFGLRSCSSAVFRRRSQPCLNYYIRKCQAPCSGGISKRKYREKAVQARKFFESGPEKFIAELRVRMQKASTRNDFEKAAALRDKIFMIERSIDRPAGEDRGKKALGRTKALEELRLALGLSRKPLRIEAFDISNTGASETVGAMAVFVRGFPFKKHYRKFKISHRLLPDDTAAIYETVFRRYSGSLAKQLPLPDLILIDGGAAQRASADKALSDSGTRADLISLAKKHEEVYLSAKTAPITLSEDSKALLLLRALRDEVHRFAVSFHRSRRRKHLIS
jgi:excinuclease ABC subunit C